MEIDENAISFYEVGLRYGSVMFAKYGRMRRNRCFHWVYKS